MAHTPGAHRASGVKQYMASAGATQTHTQAPPEWNESQPLQDLLSSPATYSRRRNGARDRKDTHDIKEKQKSRTMVSF